MIDPSVLNAFIGAGGGVIGSLLIFLGVRFTARQSAKASAATAAVTASPAQQNADTARWEALLEGQRGELDRLAGRVGTLEAALDTARGRIDTLETDLHSERTRYRALLAYCRELLTWARAIAHDVTPPTAPATFADELV